MAKKTVASLQKGEGRTFSKIIIMEKSPKTGAYIFKEEMVPNDAVQAALKGFPKFTSIYSNNDSGLFSPLSLFEYMAIIYLFMSR